MGKENILEKFLKKTKYSFLLGLTGIITLTSCSAIKFLETNFQRNYIPYNSPFFDSDGDGIPNINDPWPFQFGPYVDTNRNGVLDLLDLPIYSIFNPYYPFYPHKKIHKYNRSKHHYKPTPRPFRKSKCPYKKGWQNFYNKTNNSFHKRIRKKSIFPKRNFRK